MHYGIVYFIYCDVCHRVGHFNGDNLCYHEIFWWIIITAILAAVAGTVIYTVIYALLGQGLIAAFIAGIAWLLALQMLYSIGWIKSLIIAAVIWVVTSIVGWILQTLAGPL